MTIEKLTALRDLLAEYRNECRDIGYPAVARKTDDIRDCVVSDIQDCESVAGAQPPSVADESDRTRTGVDFSERFTRVTTEVKP